MRNTISRATAEKIKAELELLSRSPVEVDGKMLDAKSCYYFDGDPFHILYSTNCPDSLKKKIDQIISIYTNKDENSVY